MHVFGILPIDVYSEIEPMGFKHGDIVFPLSTDVFFNKNPDGTYTDEKNIQFVMSAPVDKDGKKLGTDIVFDIKIIMPMSLNSSGKLERTPTKTQ